MSLLKHIFNFLIEKVLPIKFKVWLLDRLACDIANQGEDGDTELAHINSYEAKLLRSVGGSGTLNSKTGLRQYGGGGSKSAPAPAATSTVVEKAEFPPELRPFITDILEKAQAQEQARLATGYPVYPGPRIAQFTPEERAAQAGIVSLVGSQEPTFDIAKGLTAASAMEDTAGAIQQRMSPYMQNVVDIQKREAQRDADVRRQQLDAQAVAARAFGGSRAGIQQAEFDRNLQQQLADIQATGQQAAFQQAQQGLANLRQRQAQAGQQMAGFAPIQSGVQFKELGALAGIGEQNRQQQQRALDLGFQQFREEQTFPEASLQQYQSIIRGFPLQPTTTQTQQSILPTPSLGQQLIGLGTGALGLAGAARTLFKEGGPLKPIPEENKGLKALAKESPDTVEKMGFKPLKKGKRPKITKKQNQMYKEMLYAMLSDDKRDNINESINEIADIMKEKGISTLSKDGGVVKLQPGGQVPDINIEAEPFEITTFGTDYTSDEIKQLLERAKARSTRADELGMVMSDEERQKQIEEDKAAAKLRAYMQLAQLGGDILAADPSRGTLAAVGSAASKAAPGFMEAAKEFKDVDRKARKEKIDETLKQITAESSTDKDVLEILKTDADYKAAIQKAGDLGLSIVGDVKRVTDIVKGRLDATGIKNLDFDSTLLTNQGKKNITQITKIAALNALEKLKQMNKQGQLRGTDKETVYNSLLIDEIDMLGVRSPDTISKQKGGLIPATEEQKTVSQILDEIE
tara:strand:- start:529 stop:2766 length:2238 start_codon:yes stop_codon:yes gene_type:complete